MNKVAQYYRELVASLSERLRNGRRRLMRAGGAGAPARDANRECF